MGEPEVLSDSAAYALAQKIEREALVPLQEIVTLAQHTYRQQSSLRSIQARVRTLRSESDDLQQKNAAGQAEWESLNTRLTDLRREHADFVNRTEEARQANQHLTGENTRLQAQMETDMRDHRREMTQSQEAFRQQSDTEAREHEARIHTLTRDERALRDSVNDLATRKGVLENEIEVVERQIEHMQRFIQGQEE